MIQWPEAIPTVVDLAVRRCTGSIEATQPYPVNALFEVPVVQRHHVHGANPNGAHRRRG